MLEIYLLGQFEVALDGVKLEAAWPRRHARDLLQLLALQPQFRLHKEQVIEAIWPDEDAEKRLYYVIHALRKVLEPTLSQGSTSSYVLYKDSILELQNVWVDAVEFESKLVEASKTSNDKSYEKALKLYRGHLLSDNLYAPWLESERERLKQRYVAALGHLADLYQGDAGAVQKTLERLVVAEPSEVHYRKLISHHLEQGNAHEAKVQYQRCLDMLKDLELEPEAETTALLATLRQQQERPVLSVNVSSFPLVTTPLLGREYDLENVSTLLETARLVTLTGVGGVGKTRLALELSNAVQHRYTHGVVVLSLAALQVPELFIPALRQVLGVSGDVASYLKNKNMLLVLDNCEHLPGAMPVVATLLEAAPELSVLATSRTPLHLRGETCAEVKPLNLQSAVNLFQMRVRKTQPMLETSVEQNIMVAKLCQELDALPLAIELAAARRSTLSVEAIRMRLHERLDFKNRERNSPERHRSLRAALEWSLSLLPDEAKTLFTTLGVFAGSFSLEEASEICQMEPPSVLESLEVLLDHHLLVTSWREEQQVFYMLETVRTYATELLQVSDASIDLSRQHSNHYFELVSQADKNNIGPEQKLWFDKLEQSYPEIRKALGWLLEYDAIKGFNLVAMLEEFWVFKVYHDEAKVWYYKVLELTQEEKARYHAYQGLARHYSSQGNHKEAKDYLETCLRLTYVTEHPEVQITVLSYLAGTIPALASFNEVEAVYKRLFELLEIETNKDLRSLKRKGFFTQNLGCLAFRNGYLTEAEDYLEESLAIHSSISHIQGIAHNTGALASVAYMRQDWELAETYIKRCKEVCDQLGYELLRPTVLLESGLVALAKQHYKASFEYLKEGFELALQREDKEVSAEILVAFAAWGAATNNLTWAVQQLSLSRHLLLQVGAEFAERDKRLSATTEKELQERLGKRAFKAAWQLGMTQKLEDVLASLPKEQSVPSEVNTYNFVEGR